MKRENEMGNLPAFKFIDGKLVELPKQEFRSTLVEYVPRKIEPKLVKRKLTPRMRRFYARKGRPRKQAKRVAMWTTEWKFPPFSRNDTVVWERHTIAINEEVPDPFRFYRLTVQLRPVCFVYLPKGIEPDDLVLNAVTRWHYETRTQSSRLSVINHTKPS